jgi:ribosomal protein S18 acetylase RimI-like enzyme
MPGMITDAASAAALLASEANVCAAFLDLVPSLPGETYDGPEMFRYMSGLSPSLWNGVVRARLTPESADQQVEEALGRFERHGVPMLWWLSYSSRPADLEQRLEERGLKLRMTLREMSADLSAIPDSVPVPAECKITEVRMAEELANAIRVMTTTYGQTDADAEAMTLHQERVGYGGDRPLHQFLGYLDGKPVSTASMHLSHGIAGIYTVATLPEARRRGIGGAVTLAALRLARDAGYRVASLQASEMGAPVYARLGFQDRFPIRMYRWPPLT